MSDSSSRPAKAASPWAQLRTWGTGRAAQYVSAALVLGWLAAYLGNWLMLSWPMLTDVEMQNDDARTALFPFHRYDDGSLSDDPIAREMLDVVPWGVRILYMVFVPLSDVFVAAKLVQAVAFGILLWAAVLLTRSRRAGLGAGALLLFFFLHDWFAVNRIAGGLPRAFGFPVFALWLAAWLGGHRRLRFLAPVLAGLTYPSVMNMILAAEGLLAVRGLGRLPTTLLLRRLKRYAIMVALSLVAVAPALVGGEERGALHTLEEAKKEPAFGKRGRLWILPFAKPTQAIGDAFIDAFRARGGSPVEALKKEVEQDEDMYAVLLVSLFLLFPLLRLGPPPWALFAWLCGTVILYWASRVFAFRLYSPERYYSFGMRMAALTLVMATTSQVFYWLRSRGRFVARNLTAAGVIFVVWAATGNGVVHDNGMTIHAKQDRKLYEYIAQMDQDVRFATHILDGDGIPFWAARANMGAFETLQPWFKGSWARQKQRAEDTLAALYATDAERVFAYADEYDVSHFLINRARYGRGLMRHAGSFEPFNHYVKKLLRGKRPADMVFDHVPRQVIEFRHRRFMVVDVARLKQAYEAGRWPQTPPTSRSGEPSKRPERD